MVASTPTTNFPRFHSVSTGTLADLAGELEMRKFALESEMAEVMAALKSRRVTMAKGTKWHLSLTNTVRKVFDDAKLRAFLGAQSFDACRRNVLETRPSLQLVSNA
jgi:hypothetical protein